MYKFNKSMFSMMLTNWMYISDFKVGVPTKVCIGLYYRQFMTGYELWLDDHEDNLRIEWSESGCDYEAESDFELFCEERYELAGGTL